MAVEVRVLDLVFGRIDITKLRLSDVELLLETAQGRAAIYAADTGGERPRGGDDGGGGRGHRRPGVEPW